MLPEADHETHQSLQQQFEDIFKRMGCENVKIIRVERIARFGNNTRPVQIELGSKEQVQEVMRNMKNFTDNKDYSG